ncbi:MAG: hypothetical protein DME25_06685 [Verrucomicrobia bacterium]|nr:MAG: hypothetical protein DME25_06685 [Verrucomicrobiota bacterium]
MDSTTTTWPQRLWNRFVTLRRGGRTVENDPSASTPRGSTPGSPGEGNPLPAEKRKRLLVVDDNPIILKTLSLKLTAQGYDVVTAVDGASAVNAVRTQKPDLILLDISFPPDVGHPGLAWDGFLIMTWLRRLKEAQDIPIIVITGSEAAKTKDKALAAGAASFFAKPIDNDELLTVIGHTLDQKSGTTQLQA